MRRSDLTDLIGPDQAGCCVLYLGCTSVAENNDGAAAGAVNLGGNCHPSLGFELRGILTSIYSSWVICLRESPLIKTF